MGQPSTEPVVGFNVEVGRNIKMVRVFEPIHLAVDTALSSGGKRAQYTQSAYTLHPQEKNEMCGYRRGLEHAVSAGLPLLDHPEQKVRTVGVGRALFCYGLSTLRRLAEQLRSVRPMGYLPPAVVTLVGTETKVRTLSSLRGRLT